MPLSPSGFAPVVPGVTSGAGPPTSLRPEEMLSLMMGQRNPTSFQSTPDKLALVVQLLREVSKEDPRIGFLAGDALRLLLEGPQMFNRTSGGPGMTSGASGPGAGGPSMPMGGPGQIPGQTL